MFAALLSAYSLAACSSDSATTTTTVPGQPATTTIDVPGTTVQTNSAGASVVTSSDAESIHINGNDVTQSRALTGQDVQIVGTGNRATYTGQAKELYIIGKRNTVSIDNAKLIQVTGDSNRVSWHGATPEIHDIGQHNTIIEVD